MVGGLVVDLVDSVDLVDDMDGRNWSVFGLAFMCVCFLSSPVMAAEWIEAAPMHVTRQYPALAKLPDGRILAVTGHPLGGQSLASAEIYDPKTDTWSETGPLNLPRNGGEPDGLYVLPNGKVLIAGGGTGMRSANEAELYDPETGVWTVTGSMKDPRSTQTSTQLVDGRILVTGGISWATNNVQSSAEIYDYKTGEWIDGGTMSTRRYNHRAVRLTDGRVVVMGGAYEEPFHGKVLSSVEIYDPVTNEWRLTAPMQQERRAFGAAVLNDGRVLVVGGASGSADHNRQLDLVEVFDPKTEQWTSTGALNCARWGPTVTVLSSGKVLATGGMFGRFGRLDSAEIFDPATGKWTETAPLNQRRNGHRAITLDDGRVLIAGGYSGIKYLDSCEIFVE